MKENYELKNPPRKNPYAERIKKNGYSVAIHYESPEDVETDNAIETIRGLLSRPGVNAIHLYIGNGDVAQSVTSNIQQSAGVGV